MEAAYEHLTGGWVVMQVHVSVSHHRFPPSPPPFFFPSSHCLPLGITADPPYDNPQPVEGWSRDEGGDEDHIFDYKQVRG